MATVTVTPIRTFTSGETVTPEKLNELSTPTVTATLASNEVTTAKILDANVTAAKLATDAVETAKIKDANVTEGKIAAASITNAKLAASAISGQTAIDALATADTFLVHDDSATALKKATWAQIIAAAQPTGAVLQTLHTSTTAATLISTAVPQDNTAPQYAETTIILTQAITTSSDSSKVLINATISGTGGVPVLCLFDATSGDCLACSTEYTYGGYGYQMNFSFMHSPAAATTKTYYLGVGSIIGTFALNLGAGNVTFGGKLVSNMTVQEIKG